MLSDMEKEYGFKDPEYEQYKESILSLDANATEKQIEELYEVWQGLSGSKEPEIDPKLLVYDQQIAKQLEYLKSVNLRVHIPMRGSLYFTDKSKAFHAQGDRVSIRSS